MQKISKKWWTCCLFLLAFLLGISIAGTASASHHHDNRDYQIKRDDVYVRVNRDGSADVYQQVHYHFKGCFEGTMIVQDTNGLGKISDIAVSHDDVPLKKMLKNEYGDVSNYQSYFNMAENVKDLTDENYLPDEDNLSPKEIVKFGDGDFYQANTNTDGDHKKGDYRILTKVDANESNQVITYRYHLSSVAKRFQDTGEINWKIIGTSWQRKLGNVNVTIDMPTAKGKQQLWVHGAKISGQTWRHHTSRVKINAHNVNTYLEVHLLFPVTAINQAPLHHQERLAAALQTERHIQRLALFTNAANPLSYLWATVALVLPFILCFSGVLLFGRRSFVRRDRVAERLHRFDLPSTSPLETAAIYQASRNDESGTIPLATSIADLQLKGIIDVKKVDKQSTITWNWKKGQEADGPFIYYLTHEYGDQNYTVNSRQIHNDPDNSLYYKWVNTQNKWIALGGEKVGGEQSVDFISVIYFALLIFIGVLGTRLVTNDLGFALVFRSFVRALWTFLVGGILFMSTNFISKIQRRIFGRFNYTFSGMFFTYILGMASCVIIWVVMSFFGADSREMGQVMGLAPSFVTQPLVVGPVLTGIIIQLLNMAVGHFLTDYDRQGYEKLIPILQFKHMIHDMGHFKEKELPDETLWGKYYVYATAVGETKTFIQGLDQQFGEEAVNRALSRQLNIDSDQLAGGLLVSGLTARIIDHAESTSSTSGGSSDGSFGGDAGGGWGSSGGSGGDSGGGAF